MALKIEPLTRDHGRVSFDCGNNELNQYLKKPRGSIQKKEFPEHLFC
jgi:hypothetical protein